MKTTLNSLALLSGCLALASTSAMADPRRGEFAGHKLTSTLPIHERNVKGVLANGLLRVRKNTTGDLKDYEYVDVIVTPKSGTIVEVWAIRSYQDRKDALTDFEAQADVLKYLYRLACPLSKLEPSSRASFLCDPPDRYVMTVEVIPGQGGTHILQFGLQLDRLSEKLPSIRKQIEREVGKENSEKSPYVARDSFR